MKLNLTHLLLRYSSAMHAQALTGPIFITKVEGKELKPLMPHKAPLIEFIGNSINCGTGIYLDQHNAYYAYGPRVARALGTNFMLSIPDRMWRIIGYLRRN